MSQNSEKSLCRTGKMKWEKSRVTGTNQSLHKPRTVSLSQYTKHAHLFAVNKAEYERDLPWSEGFGPGNNAA